jgi:superfamily II DNA or RNA helicase
MSGLIRIDDIAEFEEVRSVRPADLTEEMRKAVKRLHEVDDIEELFRRILHERDATPHGPAEIVDILTHKLTVGGRGGLAAFILKGRSSRTIRSKDVAHQIYRLEKIAGLKLAVFGYTGTLLDSAREHFASTCERMGIAYAYMDSGDMGRLFSAYGEMCPRDGKVLRGLPCRCGYAPGAGRLNILQREALKALVREHEAKHDRALIIMPTGSGKTRVAARDSKCRDARRILYVAHTHEILDVAEAEFGSVFGADAVARLDGGAWPEARVSLSTVQQLSRHSSRVREERFDYAIVDEFHHAAAAGYRKLVAALEGSFLLGMTATPYRGDRQDIAEICRDNVAVNFGLRSGIDFGILSPYHYYGCFDDVDYSDLPIAGYTVRDLERKLIIRARHDAVVAKWRELSDNLPTLAFCCSEAHADKVVEAFLAAGIPAATYLGTTPRPVRRALIEQLRRGEVKVLCAVDVLNEGADIPFVECLLFLRPTESKRIFVQQLGRGVRRSPGKPHCTVVDFIGNFRNAYQILQYHDLRTDTPESAVRGARNSRDVLDLPLNCKVTFDERVLDIFDTQINDPRYATRGTIGQILVHRYRQLSASLGRPATRKEVDRYDILDTSHHRLVFGSWEAFARAVQRHYPMEARPDRSL